MTTEPITQPQRPLDIHFITSREQSEIGLIERFADHIKIEFPRLDPRDRETATVDGDAFTIDDIFPIHRQTQPPGMRTFHHFGDSHRFFHDPGDQN